MKKIIARFLIIEAAALSIAALLNFINHNSYWKRTIFRTQTVDFNILAHVLPTKLSYALQKNDVEALQQALNSNYELFGLVVTDCKIKEIYCPKQKIQYLSQSEQKPRAWRKYLKVKNLHNYPYNLLQNPPPLYAEWQYGSPHSKDNERQVNKNLNNGEIIGRVYYVRGVPPTYLDDIKNFIQNPVKDSGGSRIYLLTVALCLLAGFSFWTVIELVLYRKNIREKQLILETENQFTKQQNELLRAENKLARTRGFVGGIKEVIEQDFSCVILNRLQELQNIFRRLNADIDNITHDMRKAPLIRSVENISNTIEKLNNLTTEETEKDKIVTKYIKEAEETIKFITWSINELNQIANLESAPVHIQQEVANLSNNLPPNLSKKWLNITFNINYEEELWINCNSWHLKSIIKNALYNSSAALIRLRLVQGSTFEGKISVTCLRVGNEAGILVEDNGSGIPDKILERLYQVPDTVDENYVATQGRGSVIVFSYLSLHGGRVELANRKEGGAQSMFLFPLIPSCSSTIQL